MPISFFLVFATLVEYTDYLSLF